MRSFDVILQALPFAIAGGGLLALALPWRKARETAAADRAAQEDLAARIADPTSDYYGPWWHGDERKNRVNPGSGLPMVNALSDVGGNPYGSGSDDPYTFALSDD
jgi:hypothetical protein